MRTFSFPQQVIEAYRGAAVKGGDESGQAADPAPRRAPIGPAMPSPAMLAQAQQAAAEYVEQVRVLHAR